MSSPLFRYTVAMADTSDMGGRVRAILDSRGGTALVRPTTLVALTALSFAAGSLSTLRFMAPQKPAEVTVIAAPAGDLRVTRVARSRNGAQTTGGYVKVGGVGARSPQGFLVSRVAQAQAAIQVASPHNAPSSRNAPQPAAR